MQVEEGRPLYLRGGQQDDARSRADGERESGCSDKRAQETQGGGPPAAGVLARIRAILEGGAAFASESGTPRPGSHPVSVSPAPKKREAALESRPPVAALRKENSDLRGQLVESQGRVRALKEELREARASVRARTGAGFAKPYEDVPDQDHEKVVAFIEKYELDPGKDYERTLTGLIAKGEIKVRR